ncbi:PIN domain-containing protein, partial [Escherichia coli]|nr:PIN domain-containing protein [Escherichia coli]
QARAEIALVQLAWPNAIVPPAPRTEARLWLPDPADIHVLSAAIAGSADILLTFNAKDFPRHTMTEEGLERLDPDQFLMRLKAENPDVIARCVAKVHDEACRLSGEDLDLRALMKRARLPRLGKAVSRL